MPDKYRTRRHNAGRRQVVLMLILPSEFAVFGSLDGPRALERHDPSLLEIGKPAQVVSCRFPVQVKRGEYSHQRRHLFS